MSSLILYSLSVLAGVLSFVMYNIGFAIEKQAAIKLEGLRISTYFLKLITNRQWVFGLILTILSVLLYFLSLYYAPITVISPMVGIGLITLVLYAHFQLNERFSYFEIILFLLIIGCISVIALIGSQYLLQPLWESYMHELKETGSIFFFGAIAILVLVSVGLAFKTKDNSLFLSLFAGLWSSIQAIAIKSFNISVSSGPNVAAIVVILTIVGFSALSSTVALQLAFRKGKVTNIMTIYNALSSLIPILFGIVVLKEWVSFSTCEKILFCVATVTTLVSLSILSILHWSKKSRN